MTTALRDESYFFPSYSSPRLPIMPFSLASTIAMLPRLLLHPLFYSQVSDSTGGGNLPATSATTTATGGSPTPLPAIAGATQDLGTSVVNFTVGFHSSQLTGTIDLFRQPGISNWCDGRASGELIGNLVVCVTPIVSSDATTLAFAHGSICVCPTLPETWKSKFAYPNTINSINNVPGSVMLQLSHMAAPVPQEVLIPPGVQRNAVINQVLGYDPMIAFAFAGVKVTGLQFAIHGRLRLSGLSFPTGFFLEAAPKPSA